MTISPNMQRKIDKINTLIAQGYTLKKRGIAVDFRNSSGKRVNVFGFFGTPAGFSWIAFFFPFAVCTQIKEWSFFYISGAAYAIASLITGFSGVDSGSAVSLGIGIVYGHAFPYLRLLAKQSGIEEYSRAKSIFLGLFLAVASVIPSAIIDVIFEIIKQSR